MILLMITGGLFMLKKADQTIQNTLFTFGWILLLFLSAAAAFFLTAGISPGRLIPPCMFYYLWGIYCPGCGGTRAVGYLLHGQILKSLYYHPLVCYGTVLYGWFMISNTIERLTKGRLHIGLRYRPVYTVIAVILIFAGCILHNLLKFGFHIIL